MKLALSPKLVKWRRGEMDLTTVIKTALGKGALAPQLGSTKVLKKLMVIALALFVVMMMKLRMTVPPLEEAANHLKFRSTVDGI